MRKTFVLLLCIRMYPYVGRMYPYVTLMLLVCYPYVLVWCFSHDPCGSHSELRKHIIVVEEDIGVVSTNICRSCCLHDGILHDGMYAKTLKIRYPKASEVSSSHALTVNFYFSSFFYGV